MKVCMKDVSWNLCKWSEVWYRGMGENNTLRWFGHLEIKKN